MDILTNISDYLPLTPLATHIGITCLFAQVTLTLLFNKRTRILPDGPWNNLTMYTAHSVVAFPFMVILTYIGCRDWFFDRDAYGSSTATDRIFGYSNPRDIPLNYGSGAILLWDVPMGFISPPLQDPIMWAHHVGMFLVASVMNGQFCEHGNMIGYYYAPYYFGVIELSSIFLSYVDIFHPKYKHYYNWLNGKQTDKKSIKLQRLLNSVNEVARLLFAVTFLAFRGIYFPIVTFSRAIPDLIEAYETPPDGVPLWTYYFLTAMMGLFAVLQAYWGLLISKQIVKALGGGSHGKDKKKKTKKKE